MAGRRVAITGLGVVAPIGLDLEGFWAATLEGVSGIGPIEHFDASAFPVRFAGCVKGFDPERWLEKKEARRLDRFTQLAVAAADLALADAGIRPKEETEPERIACIVGSGIGGITEIGEQHKTYFDRGPDRVSPFFIPKMMLNAASGQLAIRHGFGGPNFATASACAASLHAVGTALLMLRAGMCDVAVAGGSEAAVTEVGLAGFCAARALSKRNDDPARASRPFDKDRDGFVMGEGAGILVLEDLERAKRRGARIYAELLGFGATDDAYHITAPDPHGRGAQASMRLALKDAGVRVEDVTYVNAHGTSTELNDATETKALKAVFGDHARRLLVSSTKSQIGHLLGAAGAVGLIATSKAVHHDVAPPTINYTTPDPECDLDYVPNRPKECRMDAALVNSFGFGGHNSTIVVRKLRG